MVLLGAVMADGRVTNAQRSSNGSPIFPAGLAMRRTEKAPDRSQNSNRSISEPKRRKMDPQLRRGASARTTHSANVPDLRKLRHAPIREATLEELAKISHFKSLVSGERVDAARAAELDRKLFIS